MGDKMLRYNQGKPRLSLVPTAMFSTLIDMFADLRSAPMLLIHSTAYVLEYGAVKYNPNNWRKSGSWLEVVDSAMRHFDKLFAGETHDAESGIHHAGHIACNLGFLLEFSVEDAGIDDRYKVKNERAFEETEDPVETAFHDLLSWKDGGPDEYLQSALSTLAVWFEDLPPEERDFQPGTSPFAPIPVTIQ